jgi:mono/diheme cytochrome c family protein
VHRVSGIVVAIGLSASLLAAGVVVAHSSGSRVATEKPELGRDLYRKFCGQCHALREARAVGFGSNTKRGFGDLGGPSFNELRVPYAINVRHVTQPTGGHEGVRKKITPKQLHSVAAYIARVTRGHPIPALPTDG